MAKSKEEIGCSEKGCKNKFYKMDRITPIKELPLCKYHYGVYVLMKPDTKGGEY